MIMKATQFVFHQICLITVQLKLQYVHANGLMKSRASFLCTSVRNCKSEMYWSYGKSLSSDKKFLHFTIKFNALAHSGRDYL